MGTRGMALSISLFLTCLICILPKDLNARQISGEADDKKDFRGPKLVMVDDGSTVHDVGELLIHVGNWGIFGSMPNMSVPFSFAPSAEWPPGSGVEHLYVAGLWVGAVRNGIPAVSTSAFEMEFRPTEDPIDIMYRTALGAPQGYRLPSLDADDDGDGMLDEDWLDGHDNDGDGLIDEDFAAISKQMFSCWYTDDQPIITQIYPEHNPLNIMVRQETYQWSDDDFDDFLGIEFTITNIGNETLENVYIGLFADPDIGQRDVPDYWTDDATDHWYSPAVCTDRGPAQVDLAYAYDLDGDGGQSPGYIGIMFLGHLIDPTGQVAPERVGIKTYAHFAGSQSFEEGGDPTNDFERYEVLSSETIERGAAYPRDFRMLIGTGPFAELPPGSTLVVQAAIVMGAGLDVIDNAAYAQLAYNGIWFDLDGYPFTGIDRRETPIHGPAMNVVIDRCRPELSDPITVPPGTVVWINDDCEQEDLFKTECFYSEDDSLLFRTGVDGKETQVHWLIEEDLSVPVFVTGFEAEATESGINLTWGVVSDEDVKGFRIYRKADGEKTSRLLNGDCLIPPDERKFLDNTVQAGRKYYYTLGVVRGNNSELQSQMIDVKADVYALALLQNYPNPFNPSTAVAFTLPEKAHVNLAIYDPEGRLVKNLFNEYRSEGLHEVYWDGRDNGGVTVASGIYFVRLEAGGKVLTRKMVFIK